MRTEPRIGTKIYVKETGGAGEVKAHYFQYSITGQRLHSVLVLLDNNEYGTYSPDELTKDLHALATRVTDEERSQESPVEVPGVFESFAEERSRRQLESGSEPTGVLERGSGCVEDQVLSPDTGTNL